MKNKTIFEVLHEYIPKQYIPLLFKFCIPITKMAINDKTKYVFAGKQRFFKPIMLAIYFTIYINYARYFCVFEKLACVRFVFSKLGDWVKMLF
jgi:hypothetical protein